MPAALADALTTGSHNAFMAGLETSVLVAAVAAAIGAVLAVFTPRGATGEAQAVEKD